MAFEKPDQSKQVLGELVNRINEDRRRIRLIEQSIDRILAFLGFAADPGVLCRNGLGLDYDSIALNPTNGCSIRVQ